MYWRAQAHHFQAIAVRAKGKRARSVSADLGSLCEAMAGDKPSWFDGFARDRELKADRWRLREAEYRAMAEESRNDSSRICWLQIAERCAESARWLEAGVGQRHDQLKGAGGASVPRPPPEKLGRKQRKTTWQARANQYLAVASAAHEPEVRRVVDHLARVCIDMANATEPGDGVPKSPVHVEGADIVREAGSHRWRIRETEYLAIAESCRSAEGAAAWRRLAALCGETALCLEPPSCGERRRRRESLRPDRSTNATDNA
jgi:hypothetical protein